MILNWLRFKKLMVPKTMELKDVLVVAEYFGIQEMMEKVKEDAKPKVKLPDGWVCLNVGGTLFETRRSTLAKAPDLLDDMIQKEDGTYIVDGTNNPKVSPSQIIE